MPRTDKRNGEKNMVQVALFAALNLVSGHSQELAPRPSSYSQKRSSFFKPLTLSGPEKTAWPGVEAPADLPHLPPREHCLTPNPSRDEADEDEVFGQSQSPLFRLPPSVLRLIYEKVVGDRTIHIVRRHDRLGHALCKVNASQSQEQCRERQCRGLKLPNGTYETGSGSPSLSPILQICRKIYVDAIQVLYTTNTFDFDSMESLISFSIAILPKRLDSIKSLQLAFDFGTSRQFAESTAYNDPPRWERTWRVVGSLKSLQKLWVWIAWHRPVFRPGEELYLLYHLDQVRLLQEFEVSLPSLKGKEAKRDRQLLFNIIRREA